MAKAPLVLGAIWATREAAAFEALQKMEGNEKREGLRLIHELNQNFARSLGDFATDLPMAQGIKDTVTNLIPGFSDNWDPSKEISDFYGFLNPSLSALSSVRANVRKIKDDGIRYQKKADQTTTNYDLGDEFKDEVYTTKDGRKRRVTSRIKGTKLDAMTHLYNLLDDVATRVSILDDREPTNPLVGQDVMAMIGPEGGFIRFLPVPTMTRLRRAFEILAIPFSPQEQGQSNTSDLIVGLDIEYQNPKDWRTGTQYNLSTNQRTDWAVIAGEMNKKSFGSNVWANRIIELRLGMDESKKARLRTRVELRIKMNRQRALNKMARKKENREFQEYLRSAAYEDAGSPAKYEFDKL
jgi:hypothetical protein